MLHSRSSQFRQHMLVRPSFIMSSASPNLTSAGRQQVASATPFADAETSTSELVLLGSGVSTALPRISCVLRGRPKNAGLETHKNVPCEVCERGLADPMSPNRRCNVSALLRLDGRVVLIDCGKTIRESTMRFFPRLGVQTIDAVVLTHGHADAILGLDDLRDIQEDTKPALVRQGMGDPEPHAMPVHLNESTMKDCARCFPYLIKRQESDIARRVARIDWKVFSGYFKPFHPVAGLDLEFTPVPLVHGGDYICAGFIIRGKFENDSTVAYFSDVSSVPEETMEYCQALPRIDLLIIDSLLRHVAHSSHFSLDQAVELARELRPKVTRCVGMTCSLGLHETVDPELAKLLDTDGLDIRLGFDGERLKL
jgi:phosphoribosyl 1,2-cyclic phosphodiesterase